MEFKIGDMLVFEDESGSIYQDCVCEIENNPVHIAYTEDEEDEYFHIVTCNLLEIHLDSEYDIIKINEINYNGNHTYKLKEIWTRTDEDTYKKVYELVDGKLTEISYCQGMKVYHRRQEITSEQVKQFMEKYAVKNSGENK